MRINVTPHDRLNLVQFEIDTPGGVITTETTQASLEVDISCDEDLVGIKYRYLDNAHKPASDWIVKQDASWEQPEPDGEELEDKLENELDGELEDENFEELEDDELDE